VTTQLTKTGPAGPGGAGHETDTLETVHPALDPVIEEHPAEEPQKLDSIVFGVPAVIAIGFVLWGFLSTDTLSSASSGSLGWVVLLVVVVVIGGIGATVLATRRVRGAGPSGPGGPGSTPRSGQ